MQTMQQHQRICMAIERTDAAAQRAWTDSRQIALELRRVHDLKRDSADRAVQTVQQLEARPHIGLAKAQPEAFRLLQAGSYTVGSRSSFCNADNAKRPCSIRPTRKPTCSIRIGYGTPGACFFNSMLIQR